VTVIFAIGRTIGTLPVHEAEDFPDPWRGFLLGAIFANIVPDYISLLETRYVLRLLMRSQDIVRTAGLLIADVIASFAIFYFVSIGGAVVFFVLWSPTAYPPAAAPRLYMDWVVGLIALLPEFLWLDNPDSLDREAVGVFFYSTFWTSVWLWIFGLSQVAIRAAARLNPILKIVRYLLPIEERPFRSIGVVAASLATLGYWILASLVAVV
jgi:hypothetical protein